MWGAGLGYSPSSSFFFPEMISSSSATQEVVPPPSSFSLPVSRQEVSGVESVDLTLVHHAPKIPHFLRACFYQNCLWYLDSGPQQSLSAWPPLSSPFAIRILRKMRSLEEEQEHTKNQGFHPLCHALMVPISTTCLQRFVPISSSLEMLSKDDPVVSYLQNIITPLVLVFPRGATGWKAYEWRELFRVHHPTRLVLFVQR